MDTFHYRVSQIPLVSTATDLVRNVFKDGGAAKFTEADIGFPKFPFSLESSNMVFETNLVSFFSLK